MSWTNELYKIFRNPLLTVYKKINFYRISSLYLQYGNSLKQLYYSGTFSKSEFQLSTVADSVFIVRKQIRSGHLSGTYRKFEDNQPFKHILYTFFYARVLLPSTVETHSLAHRCSPKCLCIYNRKYELDSYLIMKIRTEFSL